VEGEDEVTLSSVAPVIGTKSLGRQDVVERMKGTYCYATSERSAKREGRRRGQQAKTEIPQFVVPEGNAV